MERKPHELYEILNPMKINNHIVFSMLIKLCVLVDPTHTGNPGMLLLELLLCCVIFNYIKIRTLP